MAYKSWAVGDTLTAADMNTYVRDQAPTVCTSTTRPTTPADGKQIYESDTGRYSVYSTADSSWHVVSWAYGKTPRFTITGGNGQTLLNNTVTRYTGFSASSTNLTSITTSLATISYPGRYIVSAGGGIAGGNSATDRLWSILQNRSGSIIRRFDSQANGTNAISYHTAAGVFEVQSGDQIYVEITQASGGTLNVTDSNGREHLTGVWISEL